MLLLLIFVGCSSTKRFTSDNKLEFNESNTIRVLLNNTSSELEISVNDVIFISDDTKSLAKVSSGNKLKLVLLQKN